MTVSIRSALATASAVRRLSPVPTAGWPGWQQEASHGVQARP